MDQAKTSAPITVPSRQSPPAPVCFPRAPCTLVTRVLAALTWASFPAKRSFRGSSLLAAELSPAPGNTAHGLVWGTSPPCPSSAPPNAAWTRVPGLHVVPKPSHHNHSAQSHQDEEDIPSHHHCPGQAHQHQCPGMEVHAEGPEVLSRALPAALCSPTAAFTHTSCRDTGQRGMSWVLPHTRRQAPKPPCDVPTMALTSPASMASSAAAGQGRGWGYTGDPVPLHY